ncbi:MAG: glutamine synthetase III [Erysipelotrichaceae bacterium]
MTKHPFDDFGIHLFSETVMRDRLPSPIFKKWKTAVAKEDSLDRQTADAIAHAMKIWAIEHGATQFSHWFQPLNGTTAEKHDSFLEKDEYGDAFSRFSGKTLIKGETDGSSFPSGGLRATFEARGYTYWDITSPAFIRGTVLCIPTIFVSYNGEPLDQKAPLLRAIDVLSVEATRIANALGEKNVKRVTMQCGLEQEYFLVDLEDYHKRPDLILTGRTLVGTKPPKGQEFEDHYFGSISDHVKAFMDELNLECWKLGIFAKVEHNEVAPGQFEISSIYTDANKAVDQNHIMMDLLRKIAKKHGMAALLHEKPFAGINGSGKHNNWSLSTDDGQNLLDPGEKPAENIRFLLFCTAILKAIDLYPELLRLAASGPGNDHRLGANEAPPAVISVFMGSVIEEVLFKLVDKEPTTIAKTASKFSLSNLSYLPKDNTDRNRTSPFAFTGNKFEFRMLGSSLSAATANTVIATILADVLRDIADRLDAFKYVQDIRDEALKICGEIMKDHHRILFSGDGYADSWIDEAERRGLPNIHSFVESIDALIADKAIALFERNKIYTKDELHARAEILNEQYINTINAEAKTLIEIVERMILPEALHEIGTLETLSGKSKMVTRKEKALLGLCDDADALVTKLKDALDKANAHAEKSARGLSLLKDVTPMMMEVRTVVDTLESELPAKSYPIPSYLKMLFMLD